MTTQAAIYLRISLDMTGEGLAVSRQRDDCLKIIKDRGWDLVEEYVDQSISASNKRVTRPAYDQMVKDFEAGRFGAIVCYDLDRLTRQPRQLEDWIARAEERGLVLVTANGDADLSNDNGRLFARIKASVARSEVESKSRRQKAANLQRSKAGKPSFGRRAFGYGKNAKIIEKEAKPFRAAVDHLLGGGSIHSIAREWNTKGLTTTAGNPWKPTEVRRLLQNPRHAGLRVHQGEVVGKGTWEAIIDEDTHHAVRAVLSDPSRHKAGRPRRYLLSGLATCGVCGLTVRGVTEPRGPIYYCQSRRHIARRAEQIDGLVRDVIVARLSQPDALELLTPDEDTDRTAELRAEEARLRRTLDGLSELYADGDLDKEGLRAGSRRARARLDDVTTELLTISRQPELSGLISAANVGAKWDKLDIDTQRTIIEALLKVVIHSPGRGARRFDPKTVTLTWV